MCLQNDIPVTSYDANICRNIYLLIVDIAHVMHIHKSVYRSVLKITCCTYRTVTIPGVPIGKISALDATANFAACEAETLNHCYILGNFS